MSRRAVRLVPTPLPPPAPPHGDPNGPGVGLSLERSPFAVLDRFLPARAGPFVAVVLAAAAAVWACGWLLAVDRARLVASREWLVQPLYLAVHLGLLRAFTSVYAANFVVGASYLEGGATEASGRVKRALGWRSVAVAAAVAVPLVWLDVAWVGGGSYLGAGEGLGVAGGLGAADVLMIGVWAVEWVVNAYVWVLVLAFLWHTVRMLREREFCDPIERVLKERQYRPFLLMSAEGASLTVVFAVATFGYVALAEGATSDYAGLWVTAGLVLVGFVPSWLVLKSRIRSLVVAETDLLGDAIAEGSERLAPAGVAPSPRGIAEKLDLVVAMLRVERLDRLHAELGKGEAQSLVLKLVAPAVAVVARFFKPF